MMTLALVSFMWRWMRDAVVGLCRPDAAPAQLPEPCDRAELFRRLRELRIQRDTQASQHRFHLASLTDQWKVVQGQADEIRQQISARQSADFCASLDHSVAEDRLLAQITEKGSMSLALFIQELDRELERLCRTEPTEFFSAEWDYVATKKRLTIQTDGPSIQRRVRALHLARQRAAAMRYEPLSIAEMHTQFIQLRKTITDVTSEEITGHRAAVLAAN